MTQPSTGARVKDAVFKVWTGVHRGLFKATSGRVLGSAAGMPVVLVVSTGAKSGKQRETMLTSPVQRGDEIVLVASYGGDSRNPAWYHNLVANPTCEAVMRGSRRTMTARVATSDEKEALWDDIVKAYKGYAGYQKRTDRDIPLVILSP